MCRSITSADTAVSNASSDSIWRQNLSRQHCFLTLRLSPRCKDTEVSNSPPSLPGPQVLDHNAALEERSKMPIQKCVTAEHVKAAIAQLKEGVDHPFGSSVGYDLVY